MRKKLIVANWKMYNTIQKSSLLLHELSNRVVTHRDVDIVLCPNMLALQPLSLQVNRRQFRLGAQNCFWRDEGAFTGEVAAAMLRGIVDYVIVGHSERRHVFQESERDIRQKVQAVVRSGMKPILCVGETAFQRAEGETVEVIHDQLYSGLANVTGEEIDDIAIAYEPVWAIGSGQTPVPKDLRAVEKAIRRQVGAMFGKQAAEKIKILYGGSVNSTNAPQFLGVEGIDGLLVGGASLNAAEFAAIAELAHSEAADEQSGKEAKK